MSVAILFFYVVIEVVNATLEIFSYWDPLLYENISLGEILLTTYSPVFMIDDGACDKLWWCMYCVPTCQNENTLVTKTKAFIQLVHPTVSNRKEKQMVTQAFRN